LKGNIGPCLTDPPYLNAPYWNRYYLMGSYNPYANVDNSAGVFPPVILLVLVPTRVILILHVVHLTGFEEVRCARNEFSNGATVCNITLITHAIVIISPHNSQLQYFFFQWYLYNSTPQTYCNILLHLLFLLSISIHHQIEIVFPKSTYKPSPIHTKTPPTYC